MERRVAAAAVIHPHLRIHLFLTTFAVELTGVVHVGVVRQRQRVLVPYAICGGCRQQNTCNMKDELTAAAHVAIRTTCGGIDTTSTTHTPCVVVERHLLREKLEEMLGVRRVVYGVGKRSALDVYDEDASCARVEHPICVGGADVAYLPKLEFGTRLED